MKKIFLFTLLFALFANVNPGYSWNMDSDPDENLKEVRELMKACKSPRWDDDEDILSDYDMRDVHQEENKCLKRVAIDIINKNFSFKKNQKFRDEMIATLDQLEQSFGTVYYNYINTSDRCIADENDILSCGSQAAFLTTSL
ncbi:MAG: hypothetical protein SO314_04805 [Alphaproteobacteria bacterium]|nr:hypothetical protein [Alphaproteobacteria bacterium]